MRRTLLTNNKLYILLEFLVSLREEAGQWWWCRQDRAGPGPGYRECPHSILAMSPPGTPCWSLGTTLHSTPGGRSHSADPAQCRESPAQAGTLDREEPGWWCPGYKTTGDSRAGSSRRSAQDNVSPLSSCYHHLSVLYTDRPSRAGQATGLGTAPGLGWEKQTREKN